MVILMLPPYSPKLTSEFHLVFIDHRDVPPLGMCLPVPPLNTSLAAEAELGHNNG